MVVRANYPAEIRAESRNGHVRVHGRALYKQASTQSLQTLAFTDNSFLGLKYVYTCLKKGKRKSLIVTGSAAHVSRIKDIGIWNPRIRTVGIRNPEGWNPESKTPVDSVTWGDSFMLTCSDFLPHQFNFYFFSLIKFSNIV